MDISRAEFDEIAHERPRYRERLLIEVANYQAAGITDQVLITFTSDPYHPGDTSATRFTMTARCAGTVAMAICVLEQGRLVGQARHGFVSCGSGLLRYIVDDVG